MYEVHAMQCKSGALAVHLTIKLGSHIGSPGWGEGGRNSYCCTMIFCGQVDKQLHCHPAMDACTAAAWLSDVSTMSPA